VTPVIMPTGLPPYLEKLRKAGCVPRQQAGSYPTDHGQPPPHSRTSAWSLGSYEWIGSHVTVLWPTTALQGWKSLSSSGFTTHPVRGLFWNGSVPAAIHLHPELFHGHNIHHDSRPGTVQDSNFHYQQCLILIYRICSSTAERQGQ